MRDDVCDDPWCGCVSVGAACVRRAGAREVWEEQDERV